MSLTGFPFTERENSRDPALNRKGSVSRPFLLIVPALLALGVLIMFFIGKGAIHSKDLLYEDLESRVKRLEQRLARLEHADDRTSNARMIERVERIEKAAARLDGISVSTPSKQSQPGKQADAEPRPKPEAPEKGKAVPFHQVVEGDTLFKISRLHGVSVDELRRWNDLPPGEGIKIGWKIRISDPNGR